MNIDKPFNHVIFFFQGLLLSICEGSIHGWIQHFSCFPHHRHGYPVSFQVSQDVNSLLLSHWRKQTGSHWPKTTFKLLSPQLQNKGGEKPLAELFPQVGISPVVIFQ